MEILGPAVGMLVGLSVLAMAVWSLPNFRRAVVSDYTGLTLGTTLLLGGVVGYWIFVTLFPK
jgi:hypothetical protein